MESIIHKEPKAIMMDNDSDIDQNINKEQILKNLHKEANIFGNK